MTDTTDTDLDLAMSRLLEQELMAGAGLAPAEPVVAVVSDGLDSDVRHLTAAALGLPEDQLDPDTNLANLGVDSIAITEIMVRISRAFTIQVAPTTFFEARNLRHLADILRQRYGKAIDAHYAKAAPQPAPKAEPVKLKQGDDLAPWLARHQAHWRHPAPKPTADIPVAIIAMEGAFPQSPDLEALEAHLRAGDDCITEIPAERWDWRAVWGDPRQGPFTRIKWGGFVPGADLFDAQLFTISPHEAELMDPQHRLFMECVWALMERAGIAPSALRGRKVGLFLGINLLDYTNLANRAGLIDAQRMTGLGHAFCPNRLSFLLDVHGPSEVIDTACSSSAVALHRAVMSIRHEGCEMAVAGGSNLMLSADQHVLFSQVGMLAPDGRCKTFSAQADGYARADGVGAVLLKRLDLAERDGDPILGVIRASVEHHGGTTTSLTAPSQTAQARLIVEAHTRAGIDPRTITMIECHGTGTKLGDPIEIEGLKAAFAQLYAAHGLPAPSAPVCGIGSVKSNIGHTETTAGIAGLIKLLLALRSGIQYRTLHADTVNPLIDLSGTPFHILHREQEWTRPMVDGVAAPRRAGLSSFGAGGANVHVVVEEYAAAASQPRGPRPVVVPVSARSRDSLRRLVAALRPHVRDADVDALAWTLQTGRDPWRWRVAFVATDSADLLRQMADFVADDSAAREVPRRHAAATPDTADAQTTARAWMAGDNVEWSRLWDGVRPRRLSLPVTPFERKRYWLPESESPAAGLALRPAGDDCFRLTLGGGEFFLADHRLGDCPVLPGVAYLELARAAATACGLPVHGVRGVVWVRPLMVGAPTIVEIKVDRASGQVDIASLPTDGQRVLHAQLRLEQECPPPSAAHDLAALRAAHTRTFTAAQIYDRFGQMGLKYGPGHRAIAALWTAPGPQVLAHLTLPAIVKDSLDAFPWHPSLLDGAFQAALGMALAENGTESAAALPFAVDEMRVLGRCEPEMWVHIRPAATAPAAPRVRSLDIDLIAADGSVRVALRGFATRLPQEQTKAPVHAFTPRWQKVALKAAKIGQVVHAPADGPLDQRYAALTEQVLAAVRRRQGLVQVAIEDGPDAEALAGIVGLLRSAALEQPGLGGQVVILPPGLSDAEARLAESASAPPGSKLRLESGAWWRETWEPAAIAPAAAPWRDNQVILITGGLGGLGRHLAAAIRAAANNAVLVLCGRSAADDSAKHWLESIGAEYVAADIAAPGAAQTVVDGIRARHGRLDGVIHTAGLLDDGPLDGKDAGGVAAVLAPKVAGTLALDRALGDAPLDFLVLYSSIAAVLGSPGQTDYAAANGFVDGFAAGREVRRRAGLAQGRTRSLAWPFWAEGGMRMDPATLALTARTTGMVPLSTADGLAILAAALAADSPRLTVAAGDGGKLARLLAGTEAAPPAITTAAPAAPVLRQRLLAALMSAAARQLKVAVDDLADDEELTEYGFDSIGFTQFTNALNDLFELELTPTVFFEHPSLTALADHLAARHGTALAALLGVAEQPAPPPPPVVPLPEIRPQPVAVAAPQAEEPVAIIAMACHFPGAADVAQFWDNLDQGKDCTREIPAERWDWRAIWGDPKTQPGTCNVNRGGFIDGAAEFDPAFFGLSAPEARAMDPQQRLLLTLAWRLFEDAGLPPRRLSDSQTGVFIGIADSGYGRLAAQAGATVEGYAMTGLAPSLGPNRLSFHFNLHGPSVAVETACSSALVAVHRAVEAIRGGTCEAAMAGGANLLLQPDSFVGFARAGMLSPDGRSKPFAATADGYGRGEGVGLVLLKRLSAAERDGDRILAVIRASGENHGGRASSLTAPNPKAQADLLRSVWRRAAIDPRSAGYIEAHGTGTPLGDPIEIEALQAAFADLTREAEDRFGPAPAMACAIGSVKSNIGHLELAAGIAGLIKVVAQMQAGTIAATLHCDTLNPYLKLENGPFRVARDRQPWPRPTGQDGRTLPRRAGISSFGFGGANAHLVVEEYVAAPAAALAAPSGTALLVLSAHSPEALNALARDLRAFIARGETPLADIAHALQTMREAMEHRLAFAAAGPAEALTRLDAFLADADDPALHRGRVKGGRGAVSVLESDPDIARAIAGLAAKGRADGLLEVWVKGFAVDWGLLHGGRRPAHIALPAYPLARGQYWVQSGPAAIATPAPVPVAVEVPAEPVDDNTALAAVTDIAARVLEVAPEVLDPDAELGEFGFDSITMTGFAAKVNAELSLNLTPADFFEFATLSRLARHIAGSAVLPRRAAAPIPAQATAPVIRSAPVGDDDPIAIIGLSCAFPGAADPDGFWDVLINGRDCITDIPADRWDWREFDGDPKAEHGKTNIHRGGFIDGVFAFDPLFFGISPREAKLMDPQQRLMMMHAWKAIEDSGHAPRSLAGRRVGLFVGTSSSGYRDIIGDDTGGEGYVATGAVPSVGPNRISYFLDWHGPSEPVETACSSSLVALHRAVQSMRAGDCDMAVVGGVNTIVTPEAHINFAKAGMLAPDGRCKTFSAQANGYGRGEGVGMLVLKRLSEAEADGDPILALVRGSAVNHGGRANSLTAPNTAAQTALLREAQARASIDPATIGYVEAHGTGTKLGDPVEINALKAAFADAPSARIGIGSVKTNIGHLELAAGAASLAKVLLQLRHRTLAPSLHCAEINPYVQLQDSPFHIVRKAEDWRPAAEGVPRRAGISSFGFGGVNAHVILEEYCAPAVPLAPPGGPRVVVLSAATAERLAEQARNLRDFIAAGRLAEGDLDDLAFTLCLGRDAMKHRLALVASSLRDVREKLERFLSGDHGGLAVGRLEAGQRPGPAIAADLPADTLAARWAAGADVEWAAAFSGKRRRLRLPTYPFARDVYHIAGNTPAATPAAPYSRRIAAEHFVLRDHRVRGARILPGAMGLELARAAATDGAGFTPLLLSRVVWQHPLRLDSGSVTITVPLAAAQGDTRTFRLLSGAEDSLPHMLGRVAPSDSIAEHVDLDAIRARCGGVLSATELYATYDGLGLEYGPAFRPVEQVYLGQDEVLARLRLPDAARDGIFGLHPSLVDGAFQAALGLFTQGGDGSVALPFGLDEAHVLAPTADTLWAHVRRAASPPGTVKLDIRVTGDDGSECLRLLGFTLRLLKQEKPSGGGRARILAELTDLLARETGLPPAEIEEHAALEVYGIDSVLITRLTDLLERQHGTLPKTLFFDCRTLGALADWFAARQPQPVAAPVPAAAPQVDTNAPIAIIGMAGRFPEAPDLDQFWRNLEQGRDCIREIPPDRWDHGRFFDARPGAAGKTYGKWGGFLDGIDRFDPLFFNIAPREAQYLDPQERLFLQCAWETLEDAGLTRAAIAPAAPPLDGGAVGVFVGVMYSEYQLYGAERTAAGQPLALSSSAASIANRVSAFCGFHGPSMAVDTMCSSSLTAIHLACESLRAGSCRVALAGGVNLSLHPNKYLGLGQGRFLSSDGRCESFGKGGDGYVPGEGVGAVLLKPLAQALADGDRVLGVIRASALNHGGHTNGYTVPNPAAQAAVIGRALELAGVSARRIGYVEAHGTGTKLGDPIEIAALSRAFAAHTSETGFCAIGSVKSNIGHCESAAGMAGLAKVLLQMRHGKLAPSLHSAVLNPGIDFAATPFVVQQHLAEWPRPEDGGPRLAGLSSFGAGGANAHLIIEEFIAPDAPAPAPRRDVFPLSARDPQRLDEMITRLRAAVADSPESDLPAIAHTLQVGREAFEERFAAIATTKAELLAALESRDGARDRAGRNQGNATLDDASSLAAAWVRGAAVDWRAWRGNPVPCRLSLPPYAFARDRYWLPDETSPAAPALPLLFAPRWRERPALAEVSVPARRLVVLVEQPETARVAADGTFFPAASYDDHAARLLTLLQDLFRSRPDAALVQVVVPNASLAEGLAGLLRSARLERPSVRCQLVALDMGRADAARLLDADAASADSDIRHENSARLVRHWQEVTPPAARSPWRGDGVYLITGGNGGIGRQVCAHILARAPGATIWLCGRSARPDQDSRLRYRAADVTDSAAMGGLVAEILAEHGRLTGVIHAAGLTRDCLLVRKDPAELRAVLAPKVAGTLALDAATAACGLELFVLFGSVSGALGNAGQADYAAANAWQDAFAAHRNRLAARGERQGRAIAIDWPYWRDGGMRLGDDTIAAMERAVGARPLDTAPALAALDAILAQRDEDQVLVLDGDPGRLRGMMAPPQPVAAEKKAAPPAAMAQLVGDCVAQVLRVPADKLEPEATLDRFGMDSVSALEIVAALEQRLGPLPPTILFENPSIAQLARALEDKAPQPSQPSAPTAKADDIAIIAAAGRYPGARTPEDLWALLLAGGDGISEVPAERWDPAYSPAKGKPGASHCKWGGFLDGIACFDAGFFGYSPRAADLADPQERLFLETAWHLLERAGHTRAHLRDRYDGSVGVFVGAMYQHYAALAEDAETRSLLLLNSYSALANRVSYFFDLHGPSVAVDSMCSSGLEAVRQACHALRAGECKLALAGAVNLSLLAAKYQGLSRAGLVGSSADSRAFAEGDGYLPSEGVGAVLLKPLAEAQADGDRVLAVIKAAAANHGGHSAGYGVPNADAQARLVEECVRRAAIDPASIGYVEAAANGAALGDAIELRALTRAFATLGIRDGAIALGAVKANLGHAEAASGMAQLTKVLLQLEHRMLAPTPRPTNANRALDFDASPFRPQWQAAPWPAPSNNPRRALVSAFGAGGSNVTLVIEEAPPAAPQQPETPRRRLFPLSARTPEQLVEMLAALITHVEARPDLSLAALSRTLRRGRETMEHRVAVAAADRAGLLARLRAVRPGDPPDSVPDTPEDEAGPLLVLPPYPFARERHWLTQVEAAPAAPGPLLPLILGVLAAELGVSEIDPDAPFAQLGLDSMMALRLGYAIEEACGIRLERRDLEEATTPARLAARLAAQPRTETASPAPATAAGPWRSPLSEGQKGLWVLQSLYPQGNSYNVPLAFRVSGLDLDALERACRWLGQAFPLLTARVVDQDGELEQREGALPELRRLTLPKGMDPLDFARRRAGLPFALADEAPARFELLGGGALGADHHILLIVVHHMAFDGASAVVLAQALWNAYGRFASGADAPARPAAADFADFVAWEREFLDSDRGQAQLRHWRQELAGDLPVTHLPADRAAEPGAAIDGRTQERRLEAPLVRAARRVARDLGTTPAALFLAVLGLLLYRHTDQGDMVLGVPVLRRPERRFLDSVGYFVNMLPLRLNVAGGDSGAQLVRAAHARLVDGLDHGEVPFAAIARAVGGGLAEPLYQIGYAYQNFPPGAPAELPPGTGSAVFVPELRQPGDTAFGLELYEDGDVIRVVAGYDGARFDAATIRRLLERFARLAAALCADPQQPVGTLDMLGAGERKRLLRAPAALPRRPGLVAEWIAKQAKAHPHAVAVEANGDSLSYRRLVRRANRLARYLRQNGVRPGDGVAVLLGREADAVVVLLAALTIGAVWVPLDPEAPPQRLQSMLEASGARVVIGKGAAPLPLTIDLERDGDAIAACSARRPKTRPDADAPAYMIHTSGSTGAPKGVLVSQRALAGHVQAMIATFGLSPADAVLQFAPHVVDTALEQIVPTLVAGARLVLRTGPVWTPDALHRILSERHVTIADLPPAYLREALLAWNDEDAAAPPDLRLLVVGGEALSADTVRLWQDGPLAGVDLLNAYGPTEATITCLTHRVDPAAPPGAAVPIGRPLPGTIALVLDRDGNPVPEGVIGELHVGGERLALGYHDRPDLTAERFIPWNGGKRPLRLYRTGDLASLPPGGKGIIAFHGRTDHQVKIRGFRVEPAEIEAALAAFGLREAAVIPRHDRQGNTVLTAYVVPMPGAPWDEAALRAHMAAGLSGPMLPNSYVVLDRLPITPGGKLDRAGLPEPSVSAAATAPRDDIEHRLRGLWADILGRAPDGIGVHDDFQICGGHSLSWVRLLTEIGRAFGCRPAAAEFLDAATIARQADILRRLPAANGSDDVVPLRDGGGPPLFLVHAAAGTVDMYVELARRLPKGIAVHGLTAPGLDGGAPVSDLAALAAHHVAALRRAQPQGPYRLAGWSLGGVLAFEMAHQLRRDGQQVALLALIDAYPPDFLRRAFPDGRDPEQDFARDVLDGAGPLPAAEAARLRRLYLAHAAALDSYVPPVADVPLTVLHADHAGLDDPCCGWGNLGAAITAHALPGGHHTLLRPPHVKACAAALAQALGVAARAG